MKNNNVLTYDPKKLIMIWGPIEINGYADGTFLKITPSADAFTKKVGADGEVVRIKSANDTSEVEFTLGQTSLTNAQLSAAHTLDKALGLGVFPLLIKDLLGTTLYTWPQAWIKKTPSISRGSDVQDTVWTFDTGQATTDYIAK
jgi:hypothetical protein